MPPFSEVTRIEAAIRNYSAKELEWSLWYCRMRQAVPSARPTDLRYWSGMEDKIQAALAPPPEPKPCPTARAKRPRRGLGSAASDAPGSATIES